MKAVIKLYGTENTIIRPVLTSVVKDIFGNITDNRNIYLYLDDNSNIVKGHSKNKNKTSTDRSHALKKFTGNMNEFVRLTNYDDVLDENSGNDLNFLRPDSIPILIDKEIKFSVIPIKQKRKVNISLEYSTIDKTKLISMINGLSIEQVYPGITYYHDLEYNYVLPKNLLIMLTNILYCKNKTLKELGRETIRIGEYLSQLGDDRLTFTSPDTGLLKDSTLTILERQASVVGNLTGNLGDLKPEENEDGGYSVNLDYTFTYDEVVAFRVHYPILVYNNMINKQFIIKNKSVMQSRAGVYDPSQGAMMQAISDVDVLASPYFKMDYLATPFYDDILPKTHPSYYSRLITSLIILDPEDKKSLRNIAKIDRLEFKPQILELILGSEREYVTKMKRSIVWITLYENDVIRSDIELVLDKEGNLSSTVDLDLTKTYRVGIFLLLDFNHMNKEDKHRLTIALNENLLKVTEACNGALKEYDTTNSHLITTNKNEYMIGVTNIRNQYVPMLNVLANGYNLTYEDRKRFMSVYPDHVSMFFRMVSKDPDVELSRQVQYYSAVLNNLIDYKPKKGEK